MRRSSRFGCRRKWVTVGLFTGVFLSLCGASDATTAAVPAAVPTTAAAPASPVAVPVAVPANQKNAAAEPPSARWRISLLTVSSGSEFEERLGHSALAVEDLRSGSAVAYNFGTFKNTENLVFDFLKRNPRLQFWVASYNPGQIAIRYLHREIRNQELNLTDEQAEHLAAFMAHRVLPQNRRFEYDLFTSNCVTPIRDVIDQALGGALRDRNAALSSDTYRQGLMRGFASMPLIGAFVAVVYGPYIDAPRSRWEMLFLPDALHDAVAELRIRPTPDAPLQNLVRSEKIWRGDAYTKPFPLPHPHLITAGLLLWLLIGIICLPWARTQRYAHRMLGGLGALLLLLSGIIGLSIYYLEFMPHACALHNANRLLFSPLDLVAVPLLLLLTAERLSWRGTRVLLLVLAGTTALAGFHWLFGHAFQLPSSRCAQQHTAVIAWALLGRGVLWLCVAILCRRYFAVTDRR